MRAVNDDIEDGLLSADEEDDTMKRARKRIRRADAHLVAGAVRGNSKHRRKRARDQPDVIDERRAVHEVDDADRASKCDVADDDEGRAVASAPLAGSGTQSQSVVNADADGFETAREELGRGKRKRVARQPHTPPGTPLDANRRRAHRHRQQSSQRRNEERHVEDASQAARRVAGERDRAKRRRDAETSDERHARRRKDAAGHRHVRQRAAQQLRAELADLDALAADFDDASSEIASDSDTDHPDAESAASVIDEDDDDPTVAVIQRVERAAISLYHELGGDPDADLEVEQYEEIDNELSDDDSNNDDNNIDDTSHRAVVTDATDDEDDDDDDDDCAPKPDDGDVRLRLAKHAKGSVFPTPPSMLECQAACRAFDEAMRGDDVLTYACAACDRFQSRSCTQLVELEWSGLRVLTPSSTQPAVVVAQYEQARADVNTLLPGIMLSSAGLVTADHAPATPELG